MPKTYRFATLGDVVQALNDERRINECDVRPSHAFHARRDPCRIEAARRGVPLMWELTGATIAAGIVALVCHQAGTLPRVVTAIVTLATGG